MKDKNYAVVIGINRYWTASENLYEAVPDALRMRDWLLRVDGGSVRGQNLFLLLAPTAKVSTGIHYNRATHKNIVNAFEKLRGHSGARLFVHFSGHGISERGWSGELLIPMDCSPKQPNNAIPLPGIIDRCKYLNFDEQFFFIDACRTPWAEQLGFPPYPFPPTGPKAEVQQYVLYATRPNQPALDGVFTSTLLEGLSPEGAIRWDAAKQQNVVTFSSLHDYVAEATPPHLQVPRRAGEFGRADGKPNDPVLAAFAMPLPRPDGTRFSVAVARLENDPKGELENLLVDQLGRIGETVQVLRLGRPVLEEGLQPEERSWTARGTALRYLQETGIDGLIWGKALSLDNRVGARLHFTTPEDTIRPDPLYPIQDFTFPEAFWEDLADFVCLIVSGQGEFYAFEEARRPIAHQLDSYIEKVSRLLENSNRQDAWSSDSRATLKTYLGIALITSAEHSHMFAQQPDSRTHKLERAVRLLKNVSEEWTDLHDFERKSTLGNLAIAQRALGQVEESVKILWQLADLYNNSNDPWFIRTINLLNLGNTLCEIGQKLETASLRARQFEEAANIFAKAIEFSTPMTGLWAAAKDARSHALLGAAMNTSRQISRRLLEEAEADICDALSVFIDGSIRWSSAQHKLAAILRRLGEGDPGTARVEEAVTVLREVTNADIPPYPRVLYETSLANALSTLGARANNGNLIREALEIRAGTLPILRAINDQEGIKQCKIDVRQDLVFLIEIGEELVLMPRELHNLLAGCDAETN